MNGAPIMTSNVACSTQGCTNPVVRQCSGYKGNCGRFYCAEHSSGRLCPECAARKRHDDTLEEYWQMAKHVYDFKLNLSTRFKALDRLLAAVFIVSLIAIVLGNGDNPMVVLSLIVSFVVMLVCTVWLFFKRRTEQKAQYEHIVATRPGFKEFYKEYKKLRKDQEFDKEVEMRKKILFGTIAAAGFMYQAHKQNQEYEEYLHGTRKRLE
jgi:hypothetical protein